MFGRRGALAAAASAVIAAALAAGGCADNEEPTKTVVIEREVTVKTETVPSEPPRKKRKRDQSSGTATTTTPAEPAFVACDQNIQAEEGSTTCEFASNTFWTYWTNAYSSELSVWSPAAEAHIAISCESDGYEVSCTASDGGAVKFSQSALDAYSQSQADAYATSHDLGPDPYQGLASVPDYESPPPEYESPPSSGGNIPNYENGRGYRVQCEDGMYSQSGGISGACSGHGGVAD